MILLCSQWPLCCFLNSLKHKPHFPSSELFHDSPWTARLFAHVLMVCLLAFFLSQFKCLHIPEVFSSHHILNSQNENKFMKGAPYHFTLLNIFFSAFTPTLSLIFVEDLSISVHHSSPLGQKLSLWHKHRMHIELTVLWQLMDTQKCLCNSAIKFSHVVCIKIF